MAVDARDRALTADRGLYQPTERPGPIVAARWQGTGRYDLSDGVRGMRRYGEDYLRQVFRPVAVVGGLALPGMLDAD